ncbi:hypothetical protein BS78_06G032800 [Paspalum vaginatum]|nr:hypothetical protein BS78_06G032800 [Paspalum vaginatum]
MRRGRRSRRLEGLAGFHEDVLKEILVRLPAKSVLRCRAVCREWRRLTTDPIFLVVYHAHQPTLPLISSFRTTEDDASDRLRLDAIHLQRAELRPPVFMPRWWYPVDASCDGLVIINGYYICNLATHQLAPLVPSEGVEIDNLVGLYRHQPSGEYRVLFWTQSDIPSERYCLNDYCVLTVGSKKPRRITCSFSQIDNEMELISGMGPYIHGAPVHLHGNLHVHWKKRWDVHYHRILVFDTVAELLRQMRPPAVNPQHTMQLFDMGGKLAASCSTDAFVAMRIFALEDYESQIWSFQYRIKLPEMEIRRFQEQGNWSAKIVSGECDLLISCFGWLLQCDRNGKLLAKFQYDGDLPVVIPHALKESLIQHSFFQKKRKDCVCVLDGLHQTSSSTSVGRSRRPKKPNPRVFGDEWVN